MGNSWGILAQLGLFWAILELSWDPFGQSTDHLGSSGRLLGGSRAALGGPRASSEPSDHLRRDFVDGYGSKIPLSDFACEG